MVEHNQDEARIAITCPRWMLEDMRARARRKNITVTEWLRQAATAKRNAEDAVVAGSATPTGDDDDPSA